MGGTAADFFCEIGPLPIRLILMEDQRPPSLAKSLLSHILRGERKHILLGDFEEIYNLLCDVSHPSYMHSYFHWLTFDGSWANQSFAKEAHRILERITGSSEMAVAGIELQTRTIYQECIPDLAAEIDEHA